MKVIVSHNRKQHVYRLVCALEKKSRLKKFFTSIYFKERSFLKYLFSLSKKSSVLLKKRKFKCIEDKHVVTNVIPEIISKLISLLKIKFPNFYSERAHDNIVSWLLNFYKCDIFIGYESQSLQSFKKIKSQGGITILDLASVHPLKQNALNRKYNNILTAFKKIDMDKMQQLKINEYKYVDYVITLSEFATQSCIDAGIDRKKIREIPLGIDIDLFNLKSNYNNISFDILFVAGIRHWKGVKDLIESFKELNLNNATLTLIGNNGDAIDYIRPYLDKNIKYIAHLPQNELIVYYQNSSIFILPSYMDSFGQVIFEAMSCGTPVITTTNSAAPKYVENYQEGFIINVANKEQLKERILYFYNNRDEIERMGKNARKRVEELTWDNYYKNINNFLDEIKKQ